tara:strand:+ start:176 stop:364 length:189 start_codon:yes stop_codon:yes gene_type:complete
MNLTCCCCSGDTKGKQWHNRDKGYGLCPTCADWIMKKETPEEMGRNYGKRGIHWDIERKASA